MRNYEVMYIIKPEVEEEKVTALMEKFKSVVEEKGAEVTKLDKWGKRRLAYEINKIKEGIYVLMQFKAEPAASAELDRVMKINDDIVRHMIIREGE
ncbi:SSU ribosomal protein S6P [Desulforamulus reducens MI-1]|uniref:Small ribosomal subunit protein bS6 n=1 Tax=Desulforamulus reducens (strain ATCC BAA-1160 / DSM 100696 / MI-1) TaxID=349161 RepID=RS6_DESRM|nr:30S ribosomal protein S6 [Desulforamulus reducens]A4J9Q5.1 RecName: Full=Small ribosomal subunit protein bS6; AltName: Full=30S ribosomal protein S6 [Desulforamulus reducens MI-1]ABO51808.1 SSU ribosomal protein S6P [Desulforamulus reducens MI-1]